MHKAGYVHADIKPNNIMITGEGHVKIIDYGQSCPIGTVKERIQGTPDYIAPEQVQRRSIIPQTDVFNLGATMYWLLTQKHVPTLIPKGKAGISLRTEDTCKAPMELNPDVPPALSSLVMDCIHTDAPQRPETMALVSDRLDIAAKQFNRRKQNGEKPAEEAKPGKAPVKVPPPNPAGKSPPARAPVAKAPTPEAPEQKAPEKDGGAPAAENDQQRNAS
jgi:serine/threonine-protein kinase